MATKIKIRRGLQADLPTLDVGELGFTTDTKKFYIGSATGNVLLNAGGSELELPQLYNLWEENASDNPYRKNFVYTDPLSSTLQNLISSGDLDLQVWVYKETRRTLTSNEFTSYPVGGSIIRPIQKIVHPEDRIAPSLLTGRTRPTGSGLGLAVSLSGENIVGTPIGTASSYTSTATAINYVKTTASHYYGWVRTELPVVAGDLKADGRLKVDVSKFVTSYLANMSYIKVGTTTYLYIKKSLISENSQLVAFESSQFAAGEAANAGSGFPAVLFLRGMKGSEKQIILSYTASPSLYQVQQVNTHLGVYRNRPQLTLPCFYLRLVGSIDGTNLIYGPMLKVYFPVYFQDNFLLGYLSHKPHATLLDVPLGS